MYHPPSKRRQLIQRVAIYGLMSVTVVVLVTLLVFFMLGYRFNKADGKIEQGGLVQFSSAPSGANVTIDGKNFGTQTPTKATLNSGAHYITMARSGYRQWQKTVSLEAGSVLWLNYARLVPNELTPENVASFPIMGSAIASPDNKWMAMVSDAAEPVVTLANLGRDKIEPTTLTLPAASYTKPAKGKKQSFTLEAWDPSSRYLLVKHVYDGNKIEWLVADSSSAANAKNVTALLGIDASKLVFSNRDSNSLYALINSDVRKINLSDATMSRPLVQSVAEFSLFGDSTIAYVTKPDEKTAQRSVGYYDDGASKPRAIKVFNDKKPVSLHMAMGKYFGSIYVAISHGDTLEITTGRLPRSDSSDPSSLETVATLTIPGGADDLSIRTNGRFIMAQHDNTFTTYDLELKKLTTTRLKGAAKQAGEIGWIDNYMLWSDLDGTLRLYEFDGANQHDIMPVAEGYDVTLSPNGKYLYGISKGKDGYHLTRVQMILP